MWTSTKNDELFYYSSNKNIVDLKVICNSFSQNCLKSSF